KDHSGQTATEKARENFHHVNSCQALRHTSGGSLRADADTVPSLGPAKLLNGPCTPDPRSLALPPSLRGFLSSRTATGPRAGMRVTTAGNQIAAESPEVFAVPCCASVSGVNVHAGVCVPGRDRVRPERLCRYTARPPLALERL